MPRVSIITALYNHEKYVAAAIESVRAQTYPDWELLVWDDGSRDRSLEIAREAASRDPRVRVFTHPGGANRGQEATRNAALEKATGQLIALLDSDDLYKPRKLELLVPRFERPGVGLAYGTAEHLLERTGERQPSGVRRHPEGRVLDDLIHENFLAANAVLFRRECLGKERRFDSSFRTIGEYPLWLAIARDWDFARVPEVVSTWRDHGENLGTRLALAGKQELVALFERLLGDHAWEEHAGPLRRALARRRYDYAAELYAQLELKGARKAGLAVARDPAAGSLLRVKGAVLAALSFLGRAPNARLARAKRALWELRNPEAAAARRARESS
jgi:glycosyltransferase involved in cell wall biosynthesis